MDFDVARRITHSRMIARCKVINETLTRRTLPHHASNDIDFLIREINTHMREIGRLQRNDGSEAATRRCCPTWGDPEVFRHDLEAAMELLAQAREAIRADDQRNAKVHVSRAFKALMDHVILSERLFAERLAEERADRHQARRAFAAV